MKTLVRIKETGEPDFKELDSKQISMKLASAVVRESVVKHSLDAGDKVLLQLNINNETLEPYYTVEDIQYNDKKSEIYKRVFNEYTNMAEREFIEKVGDNTKLTKVDSYCGVVKNIDEQNHTISLSQRYIDGSNKHIIKKLRLTENQFNKFFHKISLGKFVYIGRSYDGQKPEPGLEKDTQGWTVKKLFINNNTKSSDIVKQFNNFKNEIAQENSMPLHNSDIIRNIKMGKVKEINHNSVLGVYDLKLEMVNGNKNYYMRLDQELVKEYIKSEVIKKNEFIFAVPIVYKRDSNKKYEKIYDIVVKDGIEKEVLSKYAELSVQKPILDSHELTV